MGDAAGRQLARVLDAVCRQAAAAVESDRAAVYLWQRDGALGLGWLHGCADRRGAVAAGEAIAALAKGRTAQVVDGGTDLGGPWGSAEGVEHVLLAPLRPGGVPLGVLVLARTGPGSRPFQARCRRVADAVAEQAGEVIETTRRLAGERSALRRLRADDERRSDHIAGLSHDLRAPLTALLGYVRTMRNLDEALASEERAEFLGIMERQIHRLSGLVEDLLIDARIDAGRLGPDNPGEVDLGELVAGICETLPPAQRDRVVLERGPAAAVRGDRRQLERVVQNLVDNALRHNPASTRVTVRTAGAEGQVLLAVHDDGPGIPPQILAGLFARYGGESDRRPGSTRLGLYTVRGIVEGHGGRIDVVSDDATGTTFEVWLPAPGEAARG